MLNMFISKFGVINTGDSEEYCPPKRLLHLRAQHGRSPYLPPSPVPGRGKTLCLRAEAGVRATPLVKGNNVSAKTMKGYFIYTPPNNYCLLAIDRTVPRL